jgi:hypothetical protein
MARGDLALESPRNKPWHVGSNASASASGQKPSTPHLQLDTGSSTNTPRNDSVHSLPGELGLDQDEMHLGTNVLADKELGAFMSYIQSIMQDARTETIHLFDICMHADKSTAAAAFYNGEMHNSVLVLADKNILGVKQPSSFSDISITLKY